MTFAVLIWAALLLVISCGVADGPVWIIFLITPFVCVGAVLFKQWLVERKDKRNNR